MSHPQRGPVIAALVHPARSAKAPAIQHQPLQTHTVQQGFRNHNENASAHTVPLPSPPVGTHVTAPTPQPDAQRLDPEALAESQSPQPPPAHASGSSTTANSQPHLTALSLSGIQIGLDMRSVEKPERQGRTCMRCGSKTCPGRQSSSLCPNPCQDCQKGPTECLGRHSSFPKKKCTEVKELKEKELAAKAAKRARR
jgi:hypothetical protein